jgi:prepilin-type N-terminal cleavage/methylation domain-containing protein
MQQQMGFSLLELSIVLVIIGLLAGGVMVGQDLVKQAELRSVTVDIQKVQAAINAFKNKYSSLPGDMRNATAYWGTAATCPATNVAPLTGAATCNGNGNGTMLSAEIDTTSPEFWLLWHHLAQAGLYEGSFTGASVIAGTQARPGVNVPETRINGVGMTVFTHSNLSTNNALWWYANPSLVIWIGTERSGNGTLNPAFSSADAYAIDIKYDNGMPGSGILRTMKQTNCVLGVTSTSSQTSSVYDLTQAGNNCSIMFSLSGNPGTAN